MSFLLKFMPAILFWGAFIFFVLMIPYPQTLTEANALQISLFFIPLFLALMFSFNIFLKNALISFSISLGLIFLLVLKALNSLNIVTGILIIISIGLFLSYFKKIKKRNLTKLPKIPKLSKLRKQ